MKKKNKLENSEREILESYDNDEWKSAELKKSDKAKYRKYAKAALTKDKRINIRLSSIDLESLQLRAVEEGIPYQTFISSILHKFVNGRLAETKRTK